MSETFNQRELGAIQYAKDVMRVLAKVIRDRDVKEVVKDKDIADQMVGKNIKDIDDALADDDIGPLIRKRTTPDLPLLNAEQEALVICQLGSAVFGQLPEPKEDDDENP